MHVGEVLYEEKEEMVLWISLIYCVTSNEVQIEQMGASVEWMVFDFNHGSLKWS